MPEVTKFVPERTTGAEIVDAMLRSGGALRKHPHPGGYPKGIIKNEQSGLYEALTSTLDPSLMTPEDLATRINALELSFIKLQQENLILRGQGPRLSSVITYENGLLRRRRAKKASPVSVPGNEAENLDEVPALAPVEVLVVPSSLTKAGDYAPHVIGVHPEDSVKKLALISDVDPNDVADIAWEHNMNLVDLTKVAFDEFSRREMTCYNKYGMSIRDKRAARYLVGFGLEPRVGKEGPHVFRKSIDSSLGRFVYRTNMYAGSLRLLSREKLHKPHTYTHRPLKLAPGEAVIRDRLRAEFKDELRNRIAKHRGAQVFVEPMSNDKRTRREKYHGVEMVAKRLKIGTRVSTSSQIKWLRSARDELRASAWKLATGMNPKLRTQKLREFYETEALTRSAPHATLGYWTNRWWEVSKFTPAEDVKPKWVRTWKTVRTTPMASAYHRGKYDDLPLNVLRAAERMEIISNSLIERGLYNSNEVLVMQAELQRGFGINLDRLPATDTKASVLNLRRCQQPVTIDSVIEAFS